MVFYDFLGKKIMRYFLLIAILWMSQAVAGHFILYSGSFRNGNSIPALYSCEGKDRSPQLSWINPPKNTQSFAIIAEDPDAPNGMWYHWVLWNIPASVSSFAENDTPRGSIVGKNSWNKNEYSGPCPPPTDQKHHYIFIIYALDTLLNLNENTDAVTLKKNIQDHILGTTEMGGIFKHT